MRAVTQRRRGAGGIKRPPHFLNWLMILIEGIAQMASDEQLRMVATLQDDASGPLRQLDLVTVGHKVLMARVRHEIK